MYSKTTDFGTITVQKNAVGRIVSDAAASLQGKLLLCSAKGKVCAFDGKNTLFLEMKAEEGRVLSLKIYVLVRFGAGISATTNRFMDLVNGRMEDAFGAAPLHVSVVVRGVISRKIAKRYIEVTKQ